MTATKTGTALVSIITPVFNGEKFLPKLWDSLQSQLYTNWEWIVVDDGSVDGSADYIGSIDDERIRLIRQPNAGVSAARNAGLDAMSGIFFTFVDADDIMPVDSIGYRADLLMNYPVVNIIDCSVGALVANKTELVIKYSPKPSSGRRYFSRLLLLDDEIWFGAFMMFRRTESTNSVRFSTKLKYCEDLLFTMDYASSAGERLADEKVCYFYTCDNPESVTRDIRGLCNGYVRFVEEVSRRPYVGFRQKWLLTLKVAKVATLSLLSAGYYKDVPRLLIQLGLNRQYIAN